MDDHIINEFGGTLSAEQLEVISAAADGDIVRVGTRWMVEGYTDAIFISYTTAVRWAMENVYVPRFEAGLPPV